MQKKQIRLIKKKRDSFIFYFNNQKKTNRVQKNDIKKTQTKKKTKKEKCLYSCL